jgi:poly(A) polymerase
VLYRYASTPGGGLVKKAVIYTRNEHAIDPAKIDSEAKRIITQLRHAGFSAYLVGGAVRDLLLGKVPKDFDIVTDATPSRIKHIFHNSRIIGKRFRLVHIVCGEKIFEASTFRSLEDGTVGNKFGTMDEDVKRRDFTLNALYYDPIHEHVIDYVDGVKDIEKRRIMPVIPLSTIFTDDPVRMIRAIKYAAMHGFTLPFALKHAIKRQVHLLSEISPSRITEELVKIINSGHAHDIISLAFDLKVFLYLQPSASTMLLESPEYKRDYFQRLKELDALDPTARFGERLSFLLYDFILRLTDWKEEIEAQTPQGELFARAWILCRNFILPMNPQRTEFDYALRFVMRQLGVKGKTKGKRTRKKTRPGGGSAGAGNPPQSQQTAAPPPGTRKGDTSPSPRTLG